MKKVGIITKHDIYNYGSIYQAYATLELFRKLGTAPTLIDYKYPNKYHEGSKSFFSSLKKDLLHKGNVVLKNLLPGRPHKKYVKGFQDFKEEHYTLTDKRYNSRESVFEDPPEFDLYVSGSDQIWRPEFTKGDPVFFLDFTDGRKISYSSSFGCKSIPQKYRNKYKKYLSNYSHLSVREEEGTSIVEDLINETPELVLDPSLMLNRENWLDVSNSYEINKPYILCYGSHPSSNYMESLADYLSVKSDLKVVRLYGNFFEYFIPGRKYVLDAGPAEVLSLFNNASFVFAQSFHATALSIIFEKKFISILRGESDHDSRQINILKKLGITNRMITIGDKIDDKIKILRESIDYASVINKLKKMREQSLSFLEKAINNK